MNRWVFPITIVFVLIVGIAVYSNRQSTNETETAVAAAPSNGRVPFRMEQQWLIKMKMALTEQQEMPRQIYSTGRVIPTPSNRAVVAPPVDGIIDSRVLPRIGQRVTRGQVLATLIQTPTAAEAAQIRIENSRIDAERRRLAQMEIEARARLTVAANEAERAKRLFEKKAYSQRQLEIAEADRKAAEANLAAVQEQLAALKTAPMIRTTTWSRRFRERS